MAETATTIRTTIIGLLETAAIVASGKVFDSMTTPYEDADEIPSIGVFSKGSSSEKRSKTSQEYEVTYPVVVQLVCEAVDDATLASDMDDYERKILDAVISDSTWMTPYEDVSWTGTEKGLDPTNKRRGSVVAAFDIMASEVFKPATTITFDKVHVDADPDPVNPDRPSTVWEEAIP